MSFDRQRADYFAALRWVSGMASSLRPGQLDGPTPCTDWDVRALLGHLIGTAERALATAERRSTRPIPHVVTDIPDAELGDAYATLTARILRAWTQLFGDDAVHAPWGVCTAKEAAQGFTIETVTHGWDLAVATDSPSDAPAGVAERCLPITDAAIPARLRGVMYATTVDTDSDVSATEQLANLLGRERAAGHGGPCHSVDRRSQPLGKDGRWPTG